MIFIYFSLVFFTYVVSTFIALFFEYPFRTMAKVVFSPPKKILRLNRELAKELNTNIDNLFDDSETEFDEATSVMDNSADGESSNQKASNQRNSGGKKSNLDLS